MVDPQIMSLVCKNLPKLIKPTTFQKCPSFMDLVIQNSPIPVFRLVF